jgi:Ca2+-binding RTX toxin-like protein
MRRLVLLSTAMIVVSIVASGVALAVNKIGTDGPDTLRGTNGEDNLVGRGGEDILLGQGGSDNLLGGAGDDFLGDGAFTETQPDVLVGGAGDDELTAFNDPASRDIVACGTGRDYAEVDRKDTVADDCERVRLFTYF